MMGATDGKYRWTELWRRLGATRDTTATFEQLDFSYREPQRGYHNLDHIAHCLAELDRVREQCANPDLVEAAIWFHDCVYDARRTDNEARSAELAANAMKPMGIRQDFINSVREMILATQHDREPANGDTAILLDIDLSSLGLGPHQFDTLGARIREEYSHMDEATYRQGRAELFKRFLDREHIYHTPWFRDRYEHQARANLLRSMNELSGS